MEQMEIFQILGIEPTKDEKLIKNAYREKLAVTNPEDNPEGFKRLRAAFEEACQLAKQSEEDEQPKEEDTTPSGLWVAKAAGIYGNINNRRDVETWKQLFEEDIFFALEEEENCRLKLLRFMMDHYKLPTDVWKLLDEKLEITKNREDLREYFPADFLSYIASKCERGEDVEFEQFEGEPDAPYDLFLQYYERCYHALEDGQIEQAQEFIKNADDLHIFHPVMEVCRAELYEKQEKLQDAFDALAELYERFPRDAMVCYNYAELLWRHERKQDASVIYEALKEENDSHYMANVRLTEWYYEQKLFKDAKKCAEKVLSLGGDDDFLEILNKINVEIERELETHYRKEKDWESALELCWCYLQDGRMNAGLRLAYAISDKIPAEKRAEHNGLLAKLYVEEAEYGKAIELTFAWEKSLHEKIKTDETDEEREKDEDRLRQAHVIRVQCYRCLGLKDSEYFAKAIREIETVETGTFKDIGLLLEKAQIYMEMEEYEKSLEVSRKLIEDYQIYAAYATAMETCVRQWDAGGVIRNGRACINTFPTYIRSYERMAKVYLDLEHDEELEQLLQEAKQNGIESVILDAYQYLRTHKPLETEELDKKIREFRREFRSKVDNGQMAFYETGLPILTEYLYQYPGSYMLVERAILHKAANHMEEAKEDYEKALVERPTNPYALNGLAFVYRYQGDYEKSLVYLNRAMLYRDEDMSPYIYTDRAELYALLGDHERALEDYQTFRSLAGNENHYQMHRMAVEMARLGDFDGADALIKTVLGDLIYDYYDAMVDLYQITGRAKEAEEMLLAWEKEIKKDSPKFGGLIPAKPKKEGEKEKQKVNMDDFYSRKSWQELMYGDAKASLKYFEKQNQLDQNKDGKAGLVDGIFARILLGEERHGKAIAEKLKKWIAKEKLSGTDHYHEMKKARLQLDFLAAYYDASDEALAAMLEQDKTCDICHFCNYEICKEMEAVRILYMIRIGKKEEALERLERNLERQPLDEYMIAIKNRIKN